MKHRLTISIKTLSSKLVLSAFLLLSLSSANVQAETNQWQQNHYSPSTIGGHEKVILFMANGAFDPADADYVAPDFDFFADQIMQWSEAEKIQFEESAIAFFESKFGVNVNAPEYAGRVIMVPFMIDPRWEYRMYWNSDRRSPRRGRVVRDGGFQLVVVDPNGVELGGEFAGSQVPQGSAAAYGIYNVKARRKHRQDLILPYQSRQPVLQNNGFPLSVNNQGSLIAPFEVMHPHFGEGWAFAHIFTSTSSDGMFQANIRNVLTFSKGASYSSD
ncbi:MAG: hypothetical protein ACI9WC_001530 [Arenicella sp.]|jgi:hypothetical protein